MLHQKGDGDVGEGSGYEISQNLRERVSSLWKVTKGNLINYVIALSRGSSTG